MQYSQDFDERVVPWTVAGSSTSNAYAWNYIIQPYLKSDQVVRCPSNKAIVSYTYNASLGGVNSTPMRSLASFEYPSQIPSFADANGFHDDTNNIAARSLSFILPTLTGTHVGRAIVSPTSDPKDWKFGPGSTVAGRIDADIHMEGANYCFFDGHVKWLRSVYDAAATGGPGPTAPETRDDRIAPPKKALDFNGDGIMGDDPNATPSTAGKWH